MTTRMNVHEIITSPSDQAKALGVHWDVEMDTMHVSTPQVDVISTATKQHVSHRLLMSSVKYLLLRLMTLNGPS